MIFRLIDLGREADAGDPVGSRTPVASADNGDMIFGRQVTNPFETERGLKQKVYGELGHIAERDDGLMRE